ncbi:MAG: TIGR02285 family protein [Desulfopila sp.]|jgi:uncharacterized protein (TIGR02285 family)|nr:TIGR02285 family protein [Desulfopila sp.]
MGEKMTGYVFSCRTLLLIVILVCLPGSGWAKDTISWMEAVAPPFFIHEGEFAGQGYEDIVTDIITENLPQYNHERIIANITRHYQEFKDGRKACNVGLFKTPEREEFLYYSLPSFFTLPAVIVINKDKFEAFGSTKVVRLEDVLKKNLIIGRAERRSYGKQIDEILDLHGTEENVFSYEGYELSLNFFEMLKHDRLDGLIGLPDETLYQAERLGIRDQIMTLTIAENQSGYDSWLSYVACSKNEWGKKVIEEINAILLQHRPTERYRKSYERWLDDGAIPGYRKLYDEIFLQIVE